MSQTEPFMPTLGALIVALAVSGLFIFESIMDKDWGLFCVYVGLAAVWVVLFMLTRRRQRAAVSDR